MSEALKKIITPVDGSEGCAKAARFAARLAKAVGAELELVHVYDSTVISVMGLNALTGKEIDDAVQRVSKAYFEGARRAMEDDSVVTREVVRVGSPSSEIVAFAEDEQPDLIVMGTRGHTEFKKLFLGSISSQVLQHAPCPVTVVR
ncbi:MAG: universal stress protein [Myxococcales bacterium]|nr:universal stress protein [Myxococcales bacterium]